MFSRRDDKENYQPEQGDGVNDPSCQDKKRHSSRGRTKLGNLNANVLQTKELDKKGIFTKTKDKGRSCQASSLSEITEEDIGSMTKVVPKTEFPPSQEDPMMDGGHDDKTTNINDFSINEFVSSVPKCDLFDDFPTMPPYFPAMAMPLSPLPLSPPISPYFPALNYPLYLPSPPPFSPPLVEPAPSFGVTASVEKDGFIRINLNYNVVLDISNDMALRLNNRSRESSVTLSGSGKHCAVIHPKGRVLIYEPRVEIQTEDALSVKNAKVYPRGISFTANNMALVYLLDEAGARSTSDMFHDLYATNIVDTLFEEACEGKKNIQLSIEQLEAAQYWRTEAGTDCWIFESIFIQQTLDGLVIVERTLDHGAKITLKASPSNGKIRLDSNFVQVTASLGEESHMFLRSKDRRLHYNGNNRVFMVRNAGHSAGFDEEGELRIF